MTIVDSSDQAASVSDDQGLGIVVDTLFEEAERRERQRRSLVALLVVLAAIGAGVYAIASGGARPVASPRNVRPVPVIRTAAYFGDPATEMVTEANWFDGVLIPIESSVLTTLDSVPQTRAQMFDTSAKSSANRGVTSIWVGHTRYVANPYRAQICTPRCAYTTKQWLEIEPPGTPPWAAAVQYDPAQLLAAVRRASQGTLRIVRTQPLDGTEMTEYRGTVTRQGAALIANRQRESGLVSDLGSLSTQWSHPIPGENPSSITVSLWTDRNGLGRRIVYDWSDLAVTETSGPHVPMTRTVKRETHERLVTLSHFGTAVSSKLPNTDEVKIVAPGQSCRVYTPRGGYGSC